MPGQPCALPSLSSTCLERLIVSTLLVTLMSVGVDCGEERAVSCLTEGWFGSRCQYQCHCHNVAECGANGDCKDGCQNDWFGPGCQYRSANMSVHVIGEDGRPFHKSKDDWTCGSGEVKQVKFVLSTPSILTWIRIIVETRDLVPQIKMYMHSEYDHRGKQKEKTLCPVPIVNYVDKWTVDMYCKTEKPVRYIIFKGTAVSTLCNVFVSIGRNVALKQPAIQSSTEGDGKASNAVDGLVGPVGDTWAQMKTCTRTSTKESRHFWQVTLARPIKLTRVDIYSRMDGKVKCCAQNLRGFTLIAKSGEEEVFVYVQNDTAALPVYSVVPKTQMVNTVDNIKILSSSKNINNLMLTMCEVQVFGDPVCPHGYYGRDCEKVCNCPDKDGCQVSTGACLTSCKPGFYGEDCKTRDSLRHLQTTLPSMILLYRSIFISS